MKASPLKRKRSPKEALKRSRGRSTTPEADGSRAGYSPPPNDRLKSKKVTRRNSPERRVIKESPEPEESVSNDPVLEARRRKFESMRLIDPAKANKKIKLIKNIEHSEKEEDLEESETIEMDARLSEELDEELTLNEGEDIELEPYDYEDPDENVEEQAVLMESVKEKKLAKDKVKKKKKKDKELYQVGKLKGEKRKKKHKEVTEEGPSEETETGAAFEEANASEEGDLRAELSRRRAERLNRVAPVQSARLVQSAFKGVVSE